MTNMVFTIRSLKLLCQMVVIGMSMASSLGFSASRSDIQKKITQILSDPSLKNMQIGIQATSLKADEKVFEYHPADLLKPASNVKLVTTLAALKYLGPDYRFKTKLYTDGVIKNGILQGNLYIKGFGDPLLVSEQLWFLVNDLKRVGFQEVKGDLILDDSFFDLIRTVRDGHPANGNGRDRAYDAPLGALSVNFNTTTVYVYPGSAVGKKARVVIDPDNTYVKVINRSKTLRANTSLTLDASREIGKVSDTIIVTGGIPLTYPVKRFYRNITYPHLYAAALFRRFFKEQGLSVQGKNQFKEVPPYAREILVYESRPLRILVGDLNKISNNFVAEQMLKTMAAELKQPPGSTDKGLSILQGFLQEIGVKDPYQLVNGSGLSADNKMSSAQLVEVLKYGYKNFGVFPEYMASMGIVGVDGTVSLRLQNTVAQGRIRAKTGSLFGVSALSGYLNTLNNETLAFSMIMNDPQDRTELMQGIQDKILLTLCELK
ncbi:MAG: D-alanyl-D-alanine carboxypeptidase/D-alanyl-D-alanine-endopeptidase [Deltaproteobacteria bacterium]|nr:D-alanyl-D-alanine carboxypeptidase/D-alanyl-D-alanine-endopeptidase [Deltaproteobacteria bacterium]